MSEFSDFLLYNDFIIEKEAIQLKQLNDCKCDNCNRPYSQENITKINEQNHIAYLCPLCTHLLTKPEQKERLLQMVRTRTYEQSNPDMQKIHNMFSLLITVGVFFLMVISIIAVGVATSSNVQHSIGFAESIVSIIKFGFIK